MDGGISADCLQRELLHSMYMSLHTSHLKHISGTYPTYPNSSVSFIELRVTLEKHRKRFMGIHSVIAWQ